MKKNTGKYSFTSAAYAGALSEALAQDLTASDWPQDSQAAFDRFAALDPTHNSPQKPFTYLNWMVQGYLRGHKSGHYFPAVAFNDLSEGLRVFDRYKHTFDAQDRDINQYNFHSLIEFSNRITDRMRDRIYRRLEEAPDDILAQTEILYSGGEGLALVPYTRRASAYWGEGSAWCTSDEDRPDNRFHDHNSIAPLVILMPVEPRSYKTSEDVLKDEQNEDVLHTSVELLRLVKQVDAVSPDLLKYTLSRKINEDEDVVREPWEEEFYDYIKDHQDDHEAILAAMKKTKNLVAITLGLKEELFSEKDFMLRAMKVNPQSYAFSDRDIVYEPDMMLAAIDGSIVNEHLIPQDVIDSLPQDLKTRAFYERLERDWASISYAGDFGVELSIEQQIEILERALILEGEEMVAKRLHLFPVLRPDCLYMKLNPWEELENLKDQQKNNPQAPYSIPYSPS